MTTTERQGRVYVLVDPRTNEPRYVGKTVAHSLDSYVWTAHLDPQRHAGATTRKAEWIRKLQGVGLTPIVSTACVAPESELLNLERLWIRYFHRAGCDLLNRNGKGVGGLGYRQPEESNAARRVRQKGRPRVRYTDEQKKYGHVYVLVDPRTREIRYVGKCGHALQRRLYSHMWTARNKVDDAAVQVWLRELVAVGLEPLVEVVAQPLKTELFSVEKLWRRYLESLGCDLANRRYVPTAGTQGRQAAGAKLKGRQRSAEVRAAIVAGRDAHRGPASCVKCRREFTDKRYARAHATRTCFKRSS